jgi:hypothetical protein
MALLFDTLFQATNNASSGRRSQKNKRKTTSDLQGAAAASSGSRFPFTGRRGMLLDKDRPLSQQTTYPYWHMRCKILAPPSLIVITELAAAALALTIAVSGGVCAVLWLIKVLFGTL